jgi:hypothetical protein
VLLSFLGECPLTLELEVWNYLGNASKTWDANKSFLELEYRMHFPVTALQDQARNPDKMLQVLKEIQIWRVPQPAISNWVAEESPGWLCREDFFSCLAVPLLPTVQVFSTRLIPSSWRRRRRRRLRRQRKHCLLILAPSAAKNTARQSTATDKSGGPKTHSNFGKENMTKA